MPRTPLFDYFTDYLRRFFACCYGHAAELRYALMLILIISLRRAAAFSLRCRCAGFRHDAAARRHLIISSFSMLPRCRFSLHAAAFLIRHFATPPL